MAFAMRLMTAYGCQRTEQKGDSGRGACASTHMSEHAAQLVTELGSLAQQTLACLLLELTCPSILYGVATSSAEAQSFP